MPVRMSPAAWPPLCDAGGQVDTDRRVRTFIGGGIATVATGQDIAANPADQDVVAQAAGEAVVAGLTLEDIVGRIAGQCVVEGRADNSGDIVQLVAGGMSTAGSCLLKDR